MAAAYLERMGERIRNRRDELGLSRSDVARQLPGKTNENAVYRWEKGQHRPNDDTLEALADVLQTTVGYFLADPVDKTVTPDPFSRAMEGEPDRLAALQNQVDELARVIAAHDDFTRTAAQAVRATRNSTSESITRRLATIEQNQQAILDGNSEARELLQAMRSTAEQLAVSLSLLETKLATQETERRQSAKRGSASTKHKTG